MSPEYDYRQPNEGYFRVEKVDQEKQKGRMESIDKNTQLFEMVDILHLFISHCSK